MPKNKSTREAIMAMDGTATKERWHLGTLEDKQRIEEKPAEERWHATSVHRMLVETTGRVPDRPALSFQLKGGPKDAAETVSYRELLAEVNRTANLFRNLGVGENDTVAYIMPNANETVFALLGGMAAGKVCPVNPLLEQGQIAGILRETGARTRRAQAQGHGAAPAQGEAPQIPHRPARGPDRGSLGRARRHLRLAAEWRHSQVIRHRAAPPGRLLGLDLRATLDRPKIDRERVDPPGDD
ncbi:MAG: AMP-binding protein [Pseudomonadota bacterium]